MYRLLENTSVRRKLEGLGDRDLENLTPSGLTIFPDAFQAICQPKTQSFLQATATIKSYNPLSATTFIKTSNPFSATAIVKTNNLLAATAIVKTYDPFLSTTQLRGTQA
jgi:hypothetical protein